MSKKNAADPRPSLVNRQARFEYELLETYVAGIALTGSEVKSLRAGKGQLAEAYCTFKGSEMWVFGLQITPYSHGGYANHEAIRPRKLLLNRTELEKLRKGLQEKGLTVVPLRLFFNDRNLVKLEIALARGKKLHDKRESIKTRDMDRASRRGDD